MALGALKIWASEVLFSADLNAEFANIRNNALTLISPLTGNLDFDGNKAIGLGLGSESSPSVQFTGDTNTGVFSSGADLLDFATAGVNSWRIDASGNLIAVDDATYDVGAFGATRPKDLHISGTIHTTSLTMRDDFIFCSLESGEVGELGWSFAGGTVTAPGGIAGHPGMISLETGATPDTVARLTPETAGNLGFVDGDTFDLTAIVYLNTAVADTTVRVGIGITGSGNPPSDGMYFERLSSDTNWFSVTRDASSQTRTDTTVAATISTWYKLRIRRTAAGNIRFNINGGADINHTTNISTTDLEFPVFQIINVGVGTNKQLYIDFFSLAITGLTR